MWCRVQRHTACPYYTKQRCAIATVGLGYRTAADILMEMSFHLCQPAVYSALSSPVTAGAGVTATIASTYALYAGALLVVEAPGSTLIEVVTVTSVTNATQFVATFANSHSAGAAVWGATFPTQQATDPLFTQAEMLQYLSRAQNEFLTAVPSFYQRFAQTVNAGVVYQNTPPTAIMIDRIAASALDYPITSMTRSANTVTLTLAVPHGLYQYATFTVANPSGNLTDTSFLGSFAVISAPTAYTLTYLQVGANATCTGGNMQSMQRLYELTQEELVQQNRNWQVSTTSTLTSWFEDRSGLYRWGTGGRPSSIFPVEILCAVRDTDTLGMLDGFLVPDVCLHGVKYLALAYVWSKDGVMQQPQLADFAMKRYAQVVMATQRYITAMKMGVK